MKIGYIRGKENTHIYREQIKWLKSLNVNKIFHDVSGSIQLQELIKYVRANDVVFIYSIENLGTNIKHVVQSLIALYNLDVQIFINKEKLNTETQKGQYAFSILNSLNMLNGQAGKFIRDEIENTKGRLPRELEDLKIYMDKVANKEMTVKKVCEKLNIGRTTYYRKCKELKKEMREGNVNATV